MKRKRSTIASVVTIALCFSTFLLVLGPASAAAQDVQQKAWNVLQEGIQNKNVDERAAAINSLGLLRNDPKGITAAEKALADSDPRVRVAAMTALGQMGSKGSIPKMKSVALKDKDSAVILAGAHAVLALGDNSAYGVYYAILTGQRKGGDSLLDEQLRNLRDPKKMAQLGFDVGVGFIPFASAGLSVVKAVGKDDDSPVRAAAARKLATDPDPRSGKALAAAAADKSPVVRSAALNAIALRGDASLVSAVQPALSDEKKAVRYTAAAALLRLTAKP
jgi:HEAT repeat protein